jgi:tetratricopeptide (TPR) repeat protein
MSPKRIPFWQTLMALCCLLSGGAARAERVTFNDARAATLGPSPGLDLGLYALESNPAALAELTWLQFSFNHKIFPAPHAASEIVGGSVPLGAYGTVAGGFGTSRTGEVELYNPNGRYLGRYVYHDDRIACGYGAHATPWLALGGAFNYERHVTAPGADYQNLGVDAGVYVRPLADSSYWEYAAGTFALGLTARNVIASERDIFLGRYREPVEVSAGASWARGVGRHRLALAVTLPFSEPSRTAVGCEFVVASVLAVRAGATGTQPSAGLGLDADLFSFDYSYAARDFGAAHYFTLGVNPGRDMRRRDKRRRQIEEWLAEGRSYFETGNYELAAERFADVLEWDPYDVVARQYWTRAKYHQYMAEGAAYIEAKDWERARQAYRNALMVVPEDFLATESLARVDQLEEGEVARRAEEKRIAELLARADEYRNRGAYRNALNVYRQILAAHPGHAQARKLFNETRLLLASSARPAEEPTPAPEVPEEVIQKYRDASASFNRGRVAEAVRDLQEIVTDYPDYAPARDKLVEAYLYQGLDFYSQGSLSAALRVWRQALALEPDNEKLRRYIKKAQTEIDQIR